MSWASGKSMAYSVKLPLPIRRGLYSMMRSFIIKRDILLNKISSVCDLPVRATRRRPYLETLLDCDLPQNLRRELLALIRERDLIVYCIANLPQIRKLVTSYIGVRVGEYCDPHGLIESAVLRSFAQAMDRMSPDKIGIRIDFLLANLDRLIPSLKEEHSHVPLVPRVRDVDASDERLFSEEILSDTPF